jgi:hypothetical protein
LGINVLDHISPILVKNFRLKILKFLVSVADPGSGAFLTPGSSSVPDPLPAFHFKADLDPVVSNKQKNSEKPKFVAS